MSAFSSARMLPFAGCCLPQEMDGQIAPPLLSGDPVDTPPYVAAGQQASSTSLPFLLLPPRRIECRQLHAWCALHGRAELHSTYHADIWSAANGSLARRDVRIRSPSLDKPCFRAVVSRRQPEQSTPRSRERDSEPAVSSAAKDRRCDPTRLSSTSAANRTELCKEGALGRSGCGVTNGGGAIGLALPARQSGRSSASPGRRRGPALSSSLFPASRRLQLVLQGTPARQLVSPPSPAGLGRRLFRCCRE